MTFAEGHEIAPENKEAMVEMVKEIHAKTAANPGFADAWTPPNAPKDQLDEGISEGGDYPSEDINPDDIPF